MSAMIEYNAQGIQVQYRIRVSPRARHAYLKLLEDGTIEAILPRRMSKRNVSDMLRENHDWIADVQQQLLVRQQNNPLRYEKCPDRIDLRAIGESWTVSYLEPESKPKTNKNIIEVKSGLFPQLMVYEKNSEAVTAILQKWIRTKAKKVLVPWFEKISQHIGLEYNRVSIRAQKSRWGSCSGDNNVNINMALLFLEPKLVRYVFIHELCHTIHMNHSAEFWTLVESFEAEFKELDKGLNTHSEKVPLWVHGR